MVNVERLKKAMQDRNITIERASEHIGINPATFYRRINHNGEKFTVREVGLLSELLNMDSETLQDIFFDKGLAETQETVTGHDERNI